MGEDRQLAERADAVVSHPPAIGQVQLPQRFQLCNFLEARVVHMCVALQI